MIIIKRLSLVVGGTSYAIFLAANLYPEPYVILPASALNGFGAAILWNAEGVNSSLNLTFLHRHHHIMN